MKILITGAGGNVGSGIIELLSSEHELRLSDLAPSHAGSGHRFYEADVRLIEALDEASAGVDVIIHTPAYHGIHMGSRTEQEFYELNITGTFNMFQSAVRNGVRRVVWLSSMSVYGADFYAYTKKVGEQLCQFYHERHGIEVIMLRPADFTPFDSLRHYGERLLHGGVDRRDVLQAVALAVACKQTFGAYHVVRDDRFTEEDAAQYAESPLDVWDKRYPGAKAVIEAYGMKPPSRIEANRLEKEERELGYAPRYQFGTFLQECTENGRIKDER